MQECETCAYSKRKLSPMGFRTWCWRYKCFRTLKCIDFVAKRCK